MPWHIESDHPDCPASKPYAVVKDSDGEVEGCHPSEDDAEDQLAALYASERSAWRIAMPNWLNEYLRGFADGIETLSRRLGEWLYEGRAWSGSASNYDSTEAYCSACLIDMNAAAGRDEKAQSHCMLPVKSPGSDEYDWEGIQAAAGGHGVGAVKRPDDVPEDAWNSAVKKAANTIISQYNSHDETAPDSVYEAAGKEAPERAISISNISEQVWNVLQGREVWAFIHGLYREDDGSMFVVVSERGKLYQVPIQFEDDTVDLGEWVQVKEEFTPVRSRVVVRQQADGRYRWLAVSGTSVLNKDGEIDARDLYDSFVAHAQETGEYPYRSFFHCGEASRIGQADLLLRDGVCYITSGLFDTTPVAQAVARAYMEDPETWGDSIGFVPTAEPEWVSIGEDVDVPVYTRGINKEIATLPAHDACAWFTVVSAQEVTRMRKEALDALNLLKEHGLTDEEIAAFAEAVDGVNRTVQEDGLIFRQSESAPPEEPEEVPEAEEPEDEGEETEPVGPVRTIEVDDEVLAALSSQFSGTLDPLRAEITALREAIDALVARANKGEKDLTTVTENLNKRVATLERDESDRMRELQEDMPRRQRVEVRYRPSQPDDDGGAAPMSKAEVAAETLANIPSYR